MCNRSIQLHSTGTILNIDYNKKCWQRTVCLGLDQNMRLHSMVEWLFVWRTVAFLWCFFYVCFFIYSMSKIICVNLNIAFRTSNHFYNCCFSFFCCYKLCNSKADVEGMRQLGVANGTSNLFWHRRQKHRERVRNVADM